LLTLVFVRKENVEGNRRIQRKKRCCVREVVPIRGEEEKKGKLERLVEKKDRQEEKKVKKTKERSSTERTIGRCSTERRKKRKRLKKFCHDRTKTVGPIKKEQSHDLLCGVPLLLDHAG